MAVALFVRISRSVRLPKPSYLKHLDAASLANVNP
jgi:hypothetical protein